MQYSERASGLIPLSASGAANTSACTAAVRDPHCKEYMFIGFIFFLALQNKPIFLRPGEIFMQGRFDNDHRVARYICQTAQKSQRLLFISCAVRRIQKNNIRLLFPDIAQSRKEVLLYYYSTILKLRKCQIFLNAGNSR